MPFTYVHGASKAVIKQCQGDARLALLVHLQVATRKNADELSPRHCFSPFGDKLVTIVVPDLTICSIQALVASARPTQLLKTRMNCTKFSEGGGIVRWVASRHHRTILV